MSFFTTLNYSSCNEDGETELRALDVGPGDVVGCITGSGDRALHMLLGDPLHVHAFDLNPIQNYLLELKMAAIRELDYQRYAVFLGLFQAESPSRLAEYGRLREHLSRDAADWFDQHQGLVETGVLYGGRWERYFRMAAFNMRLLRGAKIRRLFDFEDLEQQQDFVCTEWNTPFWSVLLRVSFCRPLFRFVFGDPGFYSNTAKGFSPARYIHARLTTFLENHLARSSFMLALVFLGRFVHPDCFPPYLRESCFMHLKKRLDRISIHHRELPAMLMSEEGSVCNKWSLSDVSSFLSPEQYSELFEQLAQRKGVRFCLRDFLTQRQPVDVPDGGIRYLSDLEEELAVQDRSFGYTFIVGLT